MRGRLAKGLYNTLSDARHEENLERLDSPLEELLDLIRGNPGGAFLGEQIVPRIEQLGA